MCQPFHATEYSSCSLLGMIVGLTKINYEFNKLYVFEELGKKRFYEYILYLAEKTRPVNCQASGLAHLCLTLQSSLRATP